MTRLPLAAAVLGLALLTFFQFPGHTWLYQDTQIYVPILEHLRDAPVLRNDMLAQEPHVAYTLYDEAARGLRSLTGLDFQAVLAIQQILARALGIWGLYLMATAAGLPAAAALLVAGICSLGVSIAGPTVLTVEYEPTPRAFAVPLLLCAAGSAAHRRYLGAGIAAACAFLYHPPTALPLWALFAVAALWPDRAVGPRTRWLRLLPLAAAAELLAVAARFQAGGGEPQVFFAGLTAAQEQLQRLRANYNWVSVWPGTLVLHHVLVFAVALAAFARIRRAVGLELRIFVLGLAALGILSMPASWVLLERVKWALVPQLQPMRALLFVALAMQFLTAVAGASAALDRRPREAVMWFVLAYLLPLQPVLTQAYTLRRMAVAVGLGLIAAVAVWFSAQRRLRFAPAVGLAAFFAVPMLGGVVNHPDLDPPELQQLSQWARQATPADAVFLFPDAGRAVYPGIFRSVALRAVYVDWKGGGQVNFLKSLGELWWRRWQQTGQGKFKASDVVKYPALGINYVVVQPQHRLARMPVFQNAKFVAYALP